MKLLLAIVLSLTGCGLSHAVDRDLLKQISVGNKLLLFDAENDVSIALDERDKIIRLIRDAKVDVKETEERIDDAASDGERADAKGDAKGAELAVMAGDVFELKIDFLMGNIDYLRDRLEETV